MHHANHFYGHAHIMGRYVGADYAPRIWGYLQHGWNMHDGFAVGTVFAPGYPKFVWSHACARRGWAAGMRDFMVVGSPWLYLLRLEKQEEWLAAEPARIGTIVYPFHGWEGQQVLGSHARYLDQIRATEGDVPITVCLHWNEFDNDKVREEYESAGVRVITHGQRGYLWKGTEQAFLYRQLDEMRHHRRVVSNRLSSAILYAASAGLEVGVYGDPMHLELDHAILGGVSKPQRMWPEMHQAAVPVDTLGRSPSRSSGAMTCSFQRRSSTPSGGPPSSVPTPPRPRRPRRSSSTSPGYDGSAVGRPATRTAGRRTPSWPPPHPTSSTTSCPTSRWSRRRRTSRRRTRAGATTPRPTSLQRNATTRCPLRAPPRLPPAPDRGRRAPGQPREGRASRGGRRRRRAPGSPAGAGPVTRAWTARPRGSSGCLA